MKIDWVLVGIMAVLISAVIHMGWTLGRSVAQKEQEKKKEQ